MKLHIIYLIVVLYAEVTTFGQPEGVRVLRSLGLGLDQKAVEAVRQWRFHPAMRGGQPIPVILTVEVNFSLQ